ncbi:sensor histidine kinase [Indioceanicola profundi]|uniref:sensor histidine kinase n=1 Tax=Indioceanicola profundi TaxID=2220096 RepID=UPI000E6AD0EA|nr:HWE histidine kinase domain-containing protein [Indioceanicola profundi]
MISELAGTRLAFLAGGGHTGTLMRARDWSETPLGQAAGWPQSLKALVSVMLGSNQPTFIVWGPERTLLYNDAFIPLCRQQHPSALGQAFADVFGRLAERAGPVLDRVYAGEVADTLGIPFDLRRNGDPGAARFRFSSTPVRDRDGRVSGVFCTGWEMAGESSARSTCEEAERLRTLIGQAPGYLAYFEGPAHRVSFASNAFLRLPGRHRLVGKTAREALCGPDHQAFLDILDRVHATGEAHTGRALNVSLEGEATPPAGERFTDWAFQPITDRAGQVTGILVQGSDVTERVRLEEHQRLLIGELNHRLKNTLSLVLGIARMTIGQQRNEASLDFESRMLALANAYALLTKENWGATELHDVVGTVTAPYRGRAGNFAIAGPRVRVPARAAVSVVMALHELCTNAAKYGALSREGGSVRLEWSLDGASPRRLTLTWQEAGGPAVTSPHRRGFGSQLIEQMLAHELDGNVRLDYAPTGVACVINFPIGEEDLRPAGEVLPPR